MAPNIPYPPIKVVITGCNGQLGKSFAKVAPQWPTFEMVFADKDILDICDAASWEQILKNSKPFAIINCAAYTAVDKAESDAKHAYQVNAGAVEVIGKIAKKYGIMVIHYSSDYVYHSIVDRPLREEDPLMPSNVYAQSKLLGEQNLINSGAKGFVIRTSWVYSEFGNNFVKSMLRLAATKDNLSIVNDQIGAPTFASHLAEATLKILLKIQEKCDKINGVSIFNYAGEGRISWFDFAKFIFDYSDIKTKLIAIPTEDYPTPANRPRWSVMDMSSIKKNMGIAPKYWKDGVKEVIDILSHH